LAFLTWLALSDHVKIILFASASEFCTTIPVFIELVNLFGPDRVLLKGPLPTHPLGPPLISDWFVRGVALVTTPYVAFINADILLRREWFERVSQVHRVMNNRFRPIVTSRRHNYFCPAGLETIQTVHDLKQVLNKRLRPGPKPREGLFAFDIFTFRATLLFDFVKTIPPFLMGAYFWDNWLVFRFDTEFDLVSTHNAVIWHLRHPRNSRDPNNPRWQYNHEIFRKHSVRMIGHHNCRWIARDEAILERSGEGYRTVIRLS
jgi:hypothetical protein